MPGMAKYVPTPKADEFKAGDTVQFRVDEVHGHGYLIGQLWSRAENPEKLQNPNMPPGYWNPWVRAQGKFWWVVRDDQSAFRVSEKNLRVIIRRGEFWSADELTA
jgi:hypothetical protein